MKRVETSFRHHALQGWWFLAHRVADQFTLYSSDGAPAWTNARRALAAKAASLARQTANLITAIGETFITEETEK